MANDDLLTASLLRTLDDDKVPADPLTQFQVWFAEAQAAGISDPEAMTLATVADGQPAARVVLLRGFDARGLVFFTNYASRKGRELAAHSQASLSFFWPELERQIRLEGCVEKTTPEESDAYYRTRPRGSQLGAWASPQSEPISSRAALEARLIEMEQRFAGQEVPRPPHWGGFRLVPQRIEFWQGRANRLHDRIFYRREGDAWRHERLGP